MTRDRATARKGKAKPSDGAAKPQTPGGGVKKPKAPGKTKRGSRGSRNKKKKTVVETDETKSLPFPVQAPQLDDKARTFPERKASTNEGVHISSNERRSLQRAAKFARKERKALKEEAASGGKTELATIGDKTEQTTTDATGATAKKARKPRPHKKERKAMKAEAAASGVKKEQTTTAGKTAEDDVDTTTSPRGRKRDAEAYQNPQQLAAQFISDKTLYAVRTLTELKLKLEDFKSNGMSVEVAGWVVTRWKRREERRQERISERANQRTCFQCRGAGHLVADCPFGGQDGPAAALVRGPGAGLCYKCGSTEHTSRDCSVRVKGFPFATCYVCGEQGHLVRECPTHSKGIYPDGGSCGLCGDKAHLRQDCPTLATQAKERPEHRVSRVAPLKSADDDEDDFAPDDAPKPKAKKAKIVAF